MKNIIHYSLFTCLLLAIPSLKANTLEISNVPLYLGGAVEPNVMFTLDDSGSMQWEVMPDENLHYANYLFPRPSNLYGGSTYSNQVPNFENDNVHNFFSRSAANNAVFYNPDVTYVPWSNADGSSMGNANPSAALYNPADSSRGSLNLKAQQTQYACWFEHDSSLNSAYGAPCSGNYSFWPITYYIYNGSSSDSEALRLDRSRYTRVRITDSTSSSTNFTSPSGIVRTRDQEIQNFANWFQYYRSRILTARAGVGRAFATQSENMRVGFAAINQGSQSIDGIGTQGAIISGLRSFSGSNRTNFFDKLYERVINNYGTPLRSSAKSIGQYFERTDNKGPWGATPGTDSSEAQLTCRQSYHILTTDGYWNGSSPELGNVDASDGVTISGPNNSDYQYSAVKPYSDSSSNTLADVTMHYWKRDLRTDLDNKVPTNSEDPAFWQHLVTFTVGLGVTGSLDPDTDLTALTNGTKTWSDPGSNNPAKIDDLWHAALNSRGSFFSAADPDTFADSLAGILENISSRTSSSASVAVNSGAITSDTKVYQARFDSGSWTGSFFAFGFDSDGQLSTTALWNAANKIPAPTSRKVITYTGSIGKPFQWSDITSSQQTQLGNVNVLSYIRGDQSKEQSKPSGTYRNRTSILGDIINSSPVLVQKPSSGYYDQWGNTYENDQPEDSKPYSKFISDNKSRDAMIYVGANDGMLHAFDAENGVEKFAYVPSTVYHNLSLLSQPSYTHRYYVDATPTVMDAFFDNDWHTVLVSGLGAGGQGIFALDVTTPSTFNSESTLANNVLWEFTDKNDPDLGYTYGRISVIRLNNNKWAALFSSGYNNNVDNDGDGTSTNSSNDSENGDGYIYLVDISNGQLIKKFDTEMGVNEDPTGNSRPNGIATPAAIDINKDGNVDAIYAGDLFGNVWSIDVSSTSSSNWDFSYKKNDKPEPIFKACHGSTCTSNNIQPITTNIQVVSHPSEQGYLLLFGTGKYFEVGDNQANNQITQSFYGIWDPRTSSLYEFNRTNLVEQKIISEYTASTGQYRVTTKLPVEWGVNTAVGEKRGWFIDLYNQANGNTNNYGERQISDAIIRDEKVIFTTLVPSDDACDFGGSSWLMEFNYGTGGRLDYSPVDVNGDGVINSQDMLYIDTDGDGVKEYVPVSGKGYDSIISAPRIARKTTDTEIKIMSDAETGGLVILEEAPNTTSNGRTSWIELIQ